MEADVDRVFAKWTSSTPGCAVGVAVGGKPVLTKAYGMADLEHDAPNTADTIFESGSVAKQFTAMAVLLSTDPAAMKAWRDALLAVDPGLDIRLFPEVGDPAAMATMR